MPDTTRHPAASAGVASSESHLSIGEVLGLLLEEFPDVTISKIRFLESQGLIEPERTPSGYRKFFDHDVELLRLILREQRENFLPLRVIKDRIDSGEILRSSDAAPDTPSPDMPAPDTPAPDTPARDTPAPAMPAAAMPRGIRNVEPRADRMADTPAGRPVAAEREPPDDPPMPGAPDAEQAPAPEVDDDDETEVSPPAAADDAGESGDSESDGAGPGDADVGGVEPGDASQTPRTSEAPGGEAPSDEAPSDHDPLPDVAGDLVTAPELAAMVSSTPTDVADLQRYGLIAPTETTGVALFDRDAVDVARICVRFLAVGVDVRHLRGWKTSVDRETSVYEQLTVPLLRQRNPHGRQVARERLVELCQLGTSLRQALIDAELRHHLEH